MNSAQIAKHRLLLILAKDRHDTKSRPYSTEYLMMYYARDSVAFWINL
jgi:septum formation topological specificity factor MinE